MAKLKLQVVRRQTTGLAYLLSETSGSQVLLGAMGAERAQEIADFLGVEFVHIKFGDPVEA